MALSQPGYRARLAETELPPHGALSSPSLQIPQNGRIYSHPRRESMAEMDMRQIENGAGQSRAAKPAEPAKTYCIHSYVFYSSTQFLTSTSEHYSTSIHFSSTGN